MIWTLVSLLILVVLGGFIAYYGDLQGRRWGKKRVSWFGLRPKHTAILITSLTGAFISLVSIITLLLVSPTVREVILKGEYALRENGRITAEYQRAMLQTKIKLQEGQDKIRDAKQVQARLQANAATLQEHAESAGKRVKQLEQRQQALRRRLEFVSTDLRHKEDENRRVTTRNTLLAKQNTEYERTNREFEKQNERLANRNVLFARDNVRLSGQNDRLKDNIGELTRKQADLLRTNVSLFDTNKYQIEGNKINLKRAQDEMNTRLAELDHVNQELDRARLDLSQAMNDLAGSGQYFAVNYNQIRQGRICVRAGSELARCVVAAHMSEGLIARQLNDLLNAAGKTAIKYGASAGTNGRAVRIMSKHLVTLTDEQYIYEQESLKTLGSVLSSSDKPVVVVVSAFSNAVEGEQVLIELRPTAEVSMFAAGAVLASSHINAGLSDEQIKQAIAQFLQTDVRAAIIKAGAIPEVDPLSGLSQVGQYDAIDLGVLAIRVRNVHGDVVIKAVAATAITSADPLDRSHLRLEVARASARDS